MLGIKAVKTFHDNDEALQLLKAGQLDAHIVLTGAPQSGLAKLKASDGIHFLALTESDLPQSGNGELYKRYLPADLTHEHYPQLIEPGKTVSTIATRTVLAVYNWDENSIRYRKLEKFVQEFFGKIGQFDNKSRHPKWSEVNLPAEVPGWKRFKPAQDWLDGNKRRPVANLSSREDDGELRAAFERFLKSRPSADQLLTAKDRDQLFKQFLAFQSAQAVNR